jgi:AraC-like DNA-binding protein
MCQRTLERRFHREFRASPRRLLHALRMQEAEKLLQKGLSVKAVACELFYKQPSHFCRKFKECHGVSPQAWQRANNTLPPGHR